MKKSVFVVAFLVLHVSVLRAQGADSLSFVKKFFLKFTEVTVSPEGIVQSRVYFVSYLEDEKETDILCVPSKFIQINGGANITVKSTRTVHVLTLAILDLSLRLKNGYCFQMLDLKWDVYLNYEKSFCNLGNEKHFKPEFGWGTNYLGAGIECTVPGLYTKKNNNPVEILPFFEIGNDFKGNIFPTLGFRINFPRLIWGK